MTNGIFRRVRFLIVSVIMCIHPVMDTEAWSANHALLIGIGDYKHPAVPDLEGPAYDLESLSRLLMDYWEVTPSRLLILKDRQATKFQIEKALRDLTRTTKPGDNVFVYFSGHGTSFHAKGFESLSPHTGALLPYDFEPENTHKAINSLIIGKRDIRPIMERLDRDRLVFAAFDACYSGNSVRAVGLQGAPRYFNPKALADLTDSEPIAFGSQTLKEPPYPYQKVVYISAASQREVARDIGQWLITSGQVKTFDAKPHGALTDSLLRGLSGTADTNNDGRITVGELYRFVRGRVSTRFDHTPQLLYQENNPATLKRSVLDPQKVTTRQDSDPHQTQQNQPSPTREALKVYVQGAESQLMQRVAAIQGVEIVQNNYDLYLFREEGRFQISLSNGYALSSARTDQIDKIVELISRRVVLKDLIDRKFPRQTFNVSVDLIGKGGVLIEGESLGFSINTEADSYILLLGIDPRGSISIIYPYEKHELARVKANQELRLADIAEVVPPEFGTEYIKVFAFKTKPVGFERMMAAEFWPSEPQFLELMRMIRYNEGIAQMTLTVKTAPKTAIKQNIK